MKLIADAGSSKVEWAMVRSDFLTQTWDSAGVNALQSDADSLNTAFANALRGVDLSGLTEIYYYGAGCATAEVCEKVVHALPRAKTVQVSGDLLGAARALFGKSKGLAGIIGTGSNTGLYDGENIVGNMPPLGFIVGDEGSGASMGRELLKRVYRFGLLRSEFEQWLGADYGEVLRRVYRETGANRFLASLTRFVGEYRSECHDVITATFEPFFSGIKEYYRNDSSRVALAGGLADAFADEIRAIAYKHEITITNILKRPMQGLIQYHIKYHNQ